MKTIGFVLTVLLVKLALPCHAAHSVSNELLAASQAGESSGQLIDGSSSRGNENSSDAVEYNSSFGPWRKGNPGGMQIEKGIRRQIGGVVFISPPSLSPKALGERATNTGCEGFFYCLGSALTSPITLPVQGFAGGAQLGMEKVAGLTGNGLAGFLLGSGPGAFLGLIAGAILIPVGLATGTAKAFAGLFKNGAQGS